MTEQIQKLYGLQKAHCILDGEYSTPPRLVEARVDYDEWFSQFTERFYDALLGASLSRKEQKELSTELDSNLLFPLTKERSSSGKFYSGIYSSESSAIEAATHDTISFLQKYCIIGTTNRRVAYTAGRGTNTQIGQSILGNLRKDDKLNNSYYQKYIDLLQEPKNFSLLDINSIVYSFFTRSVCIEILTNVKRHIDHRFYQYKIWEVVVDEMLLE